MLEADERRLKSVRATNMTALAVEGEEEAGDDEGGSEGGGDAAAAERAVDVAPA